MSDPIDRRRLIVGAAATAALAGCADGPIPLAEDRRPPAEGGIGGTGIVGVVTELGSIVIAGQRVALAPDTAVTDAFGPRGAEELAPGHSLTVEAEPRPGGLVARRVHITEPVIGIVEAVGQGGRELRVAGVKVVLEPGVASGVDPGMRVAVSGLWDGERVVASRLEAGRAAGPEVIAGAVAPGGRIAGLVIVPGEAELPPAGRFATVTGTRTDGHLRAGRIVPGRFTGAAGPLDRLLVEGYLETVPVAPGYTVSGLGHSFDREARLDPLAAGRALFAGPYTGRFAVTIGLSLPEGRAARRAALPPGTDIAALPGAVSTR